MSNTTILGSALPLTILNLMILGPCTAAILRCPHVCMDRIDAKGSLFGQRPISPAAIVELRALRAKAIAEIAQARAFVEARNAAVANSTAQ